MRTIPYPNCCGAYFICDLTLDDVKNVPATKADIPLISHKDSWNGTYYQSADTKYAPLASYYFSMPSIAYFITILDKKEHKELGEHLIKHGFKVVRKTKDRFLYVRIKGVK